MKQNLIFNYIIFGCSLTATVFARVYRADSMKEFIKEIRKSDSGLSIALFYYLDKKMDRDMREQVKDLLDEFKNMSSEEENVRFISVNLFKEKAGEIKNRYVHHALNQEPFFLLFKNGSTTAFKDKSGNVPVLSGFADRAKIRALIYGSFDKEIKDALKQKRKDREERRRARWYYGPSFYLGWDYPYYYGYPYYPYRYGYGWRGGWGW